MKTEKHSNLLFFYFYRCKAKSTSQLSIQIAGVVESKESDVLEELGLTLEASGRFVIVSQASAQSEQYGIIPKDRFIKINNESCDNLNPNQVAMLIQK